MGAEASVLQTVDKEAMLEAYKVLGLGPGPGLGVGAGAGVRVKANPNPTPNPNLNPKVTLSGRGRAQLVGVSCAPPAAAEAGAGSAPLRPPLPPPLPAPLSDSAALTGSPPAADKAAAGAQLAVAQEDIQLPHAPIVPEDQQPASSAAPAASAAVETAEATPAAAPAATPANPTLTAIATSASGRAQHQLVAHQRSGTALERRKRIRREKAAARVSEQTDSLAAELASSREAEAVLRQTHPNPKPTQP